MVCNAFPARPERPCGASPGGPSGDGFIVAESEGFEPPMGVNPLLISNQVPSAARPALQRLTLHTSTAKPQAQIRTSGAERLARRWRRGWDSNPRYVSVYTLSKRAPSAARPPLQTRLLSPLAKELAQERAALFREDAARDLDAVVQPRVADHVEQGIDRTGLRVRDRVHQPIDASIDERARTHRAGPEGRVHRRSLEPPAAQPPRCLVQRDDLGLRG